MDARHADDSFGDSKNDTSRPTPPDDTMLSAISLWFIRLASNEDANSASVGDDDVAIVSNREVKLDPMTRPRIRMPIAANASAPTRFSPWTVDDKWVTADCLQTTSSAVKTAHKLTAHGSGATRGGPAEDVQASVIPRESFEQF
jgi:hypothetical protein